MAFIYIEVKIVFIFFGSKHWQGSSFNSDMDPNPDSMPSILYNLIERIYQIYFTYAHNYFYADVKNLISYSLRPFGPFIFYCQRCRWIKMGRKRGKGRKLEVTRNGLWIIQYQSFKSNLPILIDVTWFSTSNYDFDEQSL